MAAAKKALHKQIGTAGVVALALAAVLLYSVWGASVIAARKQTVSQPYNNLAANQ